MGVGWKKVTLIQHLLLKDLSDLDSHASSAHPQLGRLLEIVTWGKNRHISILHRLHLVSQEPQIQSS